MKSEFKILFLTGLFLSATACGPIKKDETSGNPLPVNGQQKISSLDNALKSVGRVEAAVALLHKRAFELNDDIVKDFQAKLDIPECTISYLKTTAVQGNRKSIMLIQGANCPVEADYSIVYTALDGNTTNLTIKASFLIKDALLIAKNEIYKMSISGTGSIKAAGDKIVTSLNYTGTLVEDGKDPINLTFVQSDSASSLNPTFQASKKSTLNLRFPSEKKIVDNKEVIVANSYEMNLIWSQTLTAGKEKSTYTLDGSGITDVTYRSYINNLGMLAFQ